MLEKEKCSKTGLVIDKRNQHIAFNEAKHLYWNTLDGSYYKSVTGIVGMLTPKFDSLYWSTYGALKEVMRGVDFEAIRKQYPPNQRVQHCIEELTPEQYEEVKEKALKIVEEWKINAEESMAYGTEFHKKKEDELLSYRDSGTYVAFPETAGDVEFEVSTNMKDLYLNKNVCFPEILLFSDKYKLAGQADLLLKTADGEFFVLDYKTNKDIGINNDYDKMLYPLEHLDASKYNNYCLQLSLYAYLFKASFPYMKLNCKQLALMHFPKNKPGDFIYCFNFEEEVPVILEHYIANRGVKK